MIATAPSLQAIAVIAATVLAAIVYGTASTRPNCLEPLPARIGFILATLSLGALAYGRILPPTVAYAALCLLVVTLSIVDVLQDERARRRRVAVLSRRPVVDSVPAIWAIIASASATLLVPYAMDPETRPESIVVAVCVVAMAIIAWRVASAPLQLAGNDPHTEQASDRASRTRRTGLTSVLAVGTVFVFTNLVTPSSAAEPSYQHMAREIAFALTALILVWVFAFIWRRGDAQSSAA